MSSILIVDDSQFSRIILKKIISLTNHHVIAEAENGLEAAQLFAKHMPDVVIMDINMPVMNGIDSLKEMMRGNSQANVILCSSMGQQATITEAINEGAKDFIVKPFSQDRVVDAVARALRSNPLLVYSK